MSSISKTVRLRDPCGRFYNYVLISKPVLGALPGNMSNMFLTFSRRVVIRKVTETDTWRRILRQANSC